MGLIFRGGDGAAINILSLKGPRVCWKIVEIETSGFIFLAQNPDIFI